MKRTIVLFAVFITAIFFYPVFAHADKVGYYFAKNPVSEAMALLFISYCFLFAAGLLQKISKEMK